MGGQVFSDLLPRVMRYIDHLSASHSFDIYIVCRTYGEQPHGFIPRLLPDPARLVDNLYLLGRQAARCVIASPIHTGSSRGAGDG